MKRFLILALVSIVALTSMTLAADLKAVVEAEDFINEEGGMATKTVGRVRAIKGSLLGWDNKGHAIEWEVDIPEDGSYKLVLRYCHNRKWNTLREIQIDGAVPVDAFKSVVFKSTGGWAKDSNDWINYTITDASGQPAMVTLTKGKHTVRMMNLGGDTDSNGSVNLDRFAFLGKDVDPEILSQE
ncbi:MAG: carbohydrate-binding protein [Bacteroidota bacterium]